MASRRLGLRPVTVDFTGRTPFAHGPFAGDLVSTLRLTIGRARLRRRVWLNPLRGDPRSEPTARGMAAALPFIDCFAPAHNLESLERLLPQLAV